MMGFEEWWQPLIFTFYKIHTGYSVENWFSKKKRRSGILKAYSNKLDKNWLWLWRSWSLRMESSSAEVWKGGWKTC